MSVKSPLSGHELTREELSRGGKKSKRVPFDKMMAEKVREATEPEMGNIVQAAMKEFKDGNSRPLAYLIDRGFGKAKEVVQIIDDTEDDIDLSKLSKEELQSYSELLKKAKK